jgi:hypothetical protein
MHSVSWSFHYRSSEYNKTQYVEFRIEIVFYIRLSIKICIVIGNVSNVCKESNSLPWYLLCDKRGVSRFAFLHIWDTFMTSSVVLCFSRMRNASNRQQQLNCLDARKLNCTWSYNIWTFILSSGNCMQCCFLWVLLM